MFYLSCLNKLYRLEGTIDVQVVFYIGTLCSGFIPKFGTPHYLDLGQCDASGLLISQPENGRCWHYYYKESQGSNSFLLRN